MIRVLEYKTGWDYRRKGSEIEAHAPSYIKIKVIKARRLIISPHIRPGGVAKAHNLLIVNGVSRSLGYNERVAVDAKIGDTIELRCTLDDCDKTGCWNYWTVENARFDIPPCYMDIHSRLGDSISFLVGLESLCAENHLEAEVCRNQIYKDLLRCFQFDHIKFTERPDDAVCLDEVFGAASWSEFWLERIRNSLAGYFGFSGGATIGPPSCKIMDHGHRDNSVCVQLDSRSAANLDRHTSLDLINKLSRKYDVKVIGGKDSKKYLGAGFNYSFGNLEHEISDLYRCKFFVGADSGIAHLAGILSVKSYIINLIELRTVKNLFGRYSNMEFIDRSKLAQWCC